MTAIGLAVPEAVLPPGLDVTVYPVIALPPFEAGAVKLTVACAFPAFAVAPVGSSGTVAGVTVLDFFDAWPLPLALAAATVNV